MCLLKFGHKTIMKTGLHCQHVGDGAATSVMSEQHHSYRENFANLQKSAKQKNCCLQLLFSARDNVRSLDNFRVIMPRDQSIS